MQLLSSDRVPLMASDCVFSHSRTRAALVAAVVLLASLGLAWIGWSRDSRLAYYVSGVLAIGMFIFRRMLVARFSAANWLVRLTDNGVFVQFRSYLNQHLPSSDPTVVFLPFSAIRAARHVIERREVPHRDADSRRDRTAVEVVHWLELAVRGDLAPLTAALDAEVGKRPAGRALYRDYPVQVREPGLIQVHWSVIPSLGVFLDAVRSRVAVSEPSKMDASYTALEGLPLDEQRRRLRELALGDVLTAVTWARKLYGYDLAQAKTFVEQLTASQ